MRSNARTCFLAVALLSLVASGAVAQPTSISPFPRELSGTLAFQSDKVTNANPNGRVRLYTINLASGAVAALGTGGNWDDEQPRWSPDGGRVAFKSNRGGSYNLYVMDADGRNIVRLTEHGGNDHDPTWLPDGESMVFTSDRDRGVGRNDLYRLWLADGRVDRLTVYFEGRAIMPSVSPDGSWVAFVAQTFPYDGGWAYQVHVLELATGQTWPFDLTAPGCWPNWSPDGQSIAHVWMGSEPSRLQVVSSFGTDPVSVPGDAGRWHYYPDWSPDSRLLALSVSPEHHEGEDWDLAIADPSRSLPVQRLTTGSGNDRLPDWKPR
jgi:Tol biopolymer transport system component